MKLTYRLPEGLSHIEVKNYAEALPVKYNESVIGECVLDEKKEIGDILMSEEHETLFSKIKEHLCLSINSIGKMSEDGVVTELELKSVSIIYINEPR